MATKLLSDVELRAHFASSVGRRITIEPGTILTPAAKDFIREQGIEVVIGAAGAPRVETMTCAPIPTRNGKAVFINALTGAEMSEKGENMTHLRGNLLVPKTHPQIAFRGKLDSLQALIIETQLLSDSEGNRQVTADLDELLEFVRLILAAEVKDEPLRDIRLLGRNSEQIRHDSHHVKEVFGIDHPIPDRRMGRVCVALNKLRAHVRETELAAAAAFSGANGDCSRTDIVEALNRLSSCVYIILCRTLAGK